MYSNMYHEQPCASDLMICSNEKSRSNRKRKRKRWSRLVPPQESVMKFPDNETVYPEYRKLIPVWFWSNYYKALEWQNTHRQRLKESYGSAPQQHNLEDEKYKLVDPCPDSQNVHTESKFCDKYLKRNRTYNCHSGKQEENDFADGDCDEEFEFEMSEEMIKFFQESIKHKLEMKKLKEQHSKSGDAEVKELHEAHGEREREMKLLYGEGSCMIIGMETAIQLSFDKYCDVKSPKFWPNIPLNL